MKNDKFWILIIGIILMALLGKKSMESIVEKIAYAIKSFEGWFEGSVSQRNNNPGNLKYVGQFGAVGADDEGHAIFDTFANGWNALKNQIRIAFTGQSHVYSPDDTFYTFFAKYAEGNARQYAEYVAEKLGVSPETKLGDLLS
jgi:hypothetical protein